MFGSHALTLGTAALGILISVSGIIAAATDGPLVVKQQVAEPYRLVLQIGPPERMAMKGTAGPKSGEEMIGGQMPRCLLMDHSMAGMDMGGATCNHHVELHVHDARTGQVVKRARVAITMVGTSRHVTIRVPIMTMVGAEGGDDYHYGNNVHAGAGSYRVMTSVDGVRAGFAVQLK